MRIRTHGMNPYSISKLTTHYTIVVGTQPQEDQMAMGSYMGPHN